MIKPSSPTPISEYHNCESFDSGTPELDDWLRRRAISNQNTNASRTYVICEGEFVIGYYTLAAGSIARESVPRKMARNMPNPLPVMILGRLAVDTSHQGRGLGRFLFRDAAIRTLSAAKEFGMVGILVHAISDDARTFYLRLGFLESRDDQRTLILPLPILGSSLQSPETS